MAPLDTTQPKLIDCRTRVPRKDNKITCRQDRHRECGGDFGIINRDAEERIFPPPPQKAICTRIETGREILQQ